MFFLDKHEQRSEIGIFLNCASGTLNRIIIPTALELILMFQFLLICIFLFLTKNKKIYKVITSPSKKKF